MHKTQHDQIIPNEHRRNDINTKCNDQKQNQDFHFTIYDIHPKDSGKDRYDRAKK